MIVYGGDFGSLPGDGETAQQRLAGLEKCAQPGAELQPYRPVIWVSMKPLSLDNIVIDNFYFGVASVAKKGAESPVVFPGPAGSFGD